MIHINYGNVIKKTKIAAFDLDYTLIKTKSKKLFPIDKNDWEFLYENVPSKIKQLYDDNFTIVIITNQMGISKGKVNKEDFLFKINNIYKSLNIPLILLAATHDNEFRKPRIGFWKLIKKLDDIKVSNKSSFYVGDMAGRIKTKEFKADRTDTDRKFAYNSKIHFFTPEQFFLNKKERKWKFNGYLLNYNKEETELSENKSKELILLSGYPGSGKSTLAKKKFKNYKLLSKDLYKNKIYKMLDKELSENNQVIVEGLLFNYDKRKKYIEIAKKYDYTLRFIEIDLTFDLSYHLNIYRSLKDGSNVPKVVYHTYKKYYEKPNNKNFRIIEKYYPKIKNKVNKYYLY